MLNRGLRAIVGVSSLNLLAQILSTLGFIFITTVFYDLASLGELAIVNSYVAIISIFSTGYFDQVFYVERRLNIVSTVWTICLWLTLGTGAISFGVLTLYGVNYTIFIFTGIITQGLIKVCNTYMVANNGAVVLAKIKVLSSILYPLLVYLFYLIFGSSTFILLCAYLVSSMLVLFATLIALSTFGVSLSMIGSLFHYRRLLQVFGRYINYSKYSMMGELMRTFAFRGPTIALGLFFTSELAGVYGIAHQIVVLPVTIIMGSVSQVFIFELKTRLNEQNSPVKFVDSFIKPLLIVAVFVLLVMHFGAHHFIELIWGDKMVMLPEMLRAFEPYIFSLIMATIFQNIYTLLEEQKYLFHQKLLILVISLLCFGVSIYFNDFLLGLRLFSICLFFVGLFYSWIARRLIKIQFR